MKGALAWLAHLYTALGLALAAVIATLIVAGGDASFRLSFVLMLAATLVDATDGWLARMAGVEERTPRFDGRRLDDLIDFHTYTTLPLLLLWRAAILPPHLQCVLLLPLLASAYGFSQVEAKTEDGYFLGFPSYWNIVAFYLYLLPVPVWAAIVTLVGLAALTFVPSLYLYPTQGSRYRISTNLLAAAWIGALLFIMAGWKNASPALLWGSLAFPVYYMAASWTITIRAWRAAAGPRNAPPIIR